jgi:hypothetical protein
MNTTITSRRTLLVAGAGGVAASLGLVLKPKTLPVREALAAPEHNHAPIAGPLANATVNFGSWESGPTPLDRFAALSPPEPPNTPNNPNPAARNHHQLLPNQVTIQAGGSVSFIVGGFHHILVYDHGTQPDDINASLQNPFFTLLIDDPTNRIYRGLNPQTVPQDRVETVQFGESGVYLVICGVRPHFVNDNMYGFVRVIGH